MATTRHIGNVLIIITEYITLIDDMLVVKNGRFLNLEIELENNYRL